MDKRLAALFSRLGQAERDTLLAFAEFLAARMPPSEKLPPAEPKLLPRPPEETVIAAVKRLSASFPMLDKQHMLNETSALIMQHVVQGRPRGEVIDDLEKLFQRHYDQLLAHARGGCAESAPR